MTTTVEATPLTLQDRCDRCNAQAFVRVVFPDHGELLFCGHHYTKHEAKIAAGGATVHDERARINTKPSPSANAD